MQSFHSRVLGALLVAAALLVPAAASAQGKVDPNNPPKEAVKPTTAPKPDAGKLPQAPANTADAPKVASPPTPEKGSTAVPGWNNPPSWAAASERPQYASLPGIEKNRLIQGAGREWREFRNGPLTRFGGWFLVLVLAAILVFYLIRGKMKLQQPPTGRLIERFNAVERAAHWTVAISFVFLALTGIIILWGKHIVLPWLGYTGFAWLTVVSKNIHNFVGPLFMFSLVITFLIYVKDNVLHSYDWKWIAHFGKFIKEGHGIPSGRFNGMEKLWFWGGVVVLGIVMSVTGLILDFPNWNQGREIMQQASVIHAIAAALFIAAGLAHIYIGTIGMEGAYQAMRRGYVDEEWAKEHHPLWYEDVKAGRRPEKLMGSAPQPAPGDD